MRKEKNANSLPESDCGQLEDRGHEPVPKPHGYSAEEGEERGNENERGRSHYRNFCPAGPLRPSLATAISVFLMRHLYASYFRN
jgi:hypothetical protein